MCKMGATPNLVYGVSGNILAELEKLAMAQIYNHLTDQQTELGFTDTASMSLGKTLVLNSMKVYHLI